MQVLFILCLSLVAVHSQVVLGWSANFRMTSSANNSGVSTGTVKWRWVENADSTQQPPRRFLLELKYNNVANTAQSTELYQHNLNGGYINSASQNKFTDDAECRPTCATSGIATTIAAMAPLDPTLLNGASASSATGVNPGSAYFRAGYPTGTTYSNALFTPARAGPVTSFRATRTAGGITINSFIITDSCNPPVVKTYVLSNFVRAVPTIDPPANCLCDSILDVMIVVDQSGSIDSTEAKQFHEFVAKFINSLNVKAAGVNVGMAWFHSASGTQFLLEEDKTDIARAISNCTGASNVIGECAVSTTPVPWRTPCPTDRDGRPVGPFTDKCPDATRRTCTASGVLKGASMLYASGNNRKVPKLFITMTDGALNTLVSSTAAGQPWTGSLTGAGPSCRNSDNNLRTCDLRTDSDKCRAQLRTVMTTVKNQHNAWATAAGCGTGQCPLTLIGLGISAECVGDQDPNFCLSVDHLDILAGGTGTGGGRSNPNVLIAAWDELIGKVNQLVGLSCPDNSYSTCECQQQCGGFCAGACSSCEPPKECPVVNNLCYNILPTPIDGQCPKTPTSGVCPNPSTNCTHDTSYTCDPTMNGGNGGCRPTYTAKQACPQIGCRVTTCNTTTYECNVHSYTNCPPCQTVNGECTGAVRCGANGTYTITKVEGSEGFCSGAGEVTTGSCCLPCDCSVGPWGDFDGTCSGNCSAATEILTRNRTITPASCLGNNEQCAGLSTTDTFDCANCTVTPCVYNWAAWSCSCENGTAVRKVIIVSSPTNGGTPCPSDENQTCTCCQQTVTETDCDCDTHTYSRSYFRTVLASGPGAQDCTLPQNQTGIACDAGPACVICVTDDDCDDNDACTTDICDLNGDDGLPDGSTEKHCRYTNVSCGATNSVCFTAVCDSNFGCVINQTQICSSDKCTDGWCDDVLGCRYNESELSKNCSRDVPTDCNYAVCDPFTGCNYENIPCNSTGNCSISGCDPNWNTPVDDPENNRPCKCSNPTGPCYSYYICGVPIGLVIGLTAGGIAALVVCLAFLAFLVLSGGTYALAQQVRNADETNLNNNPLYEKSGKSGQSPLHAGNCD